MGERAVSSVLVQENEHGLEWPVYYVNKSLPRAETNYPMVEKATYGLVLSARRLKPYFLRFFVIVRSNIPIRDILRKIDHWGQISKWCIN